jgi:hypothetical protein
VHRTRQCPATGTTIAEALAMEQALLLPVPAVHEPFDCVVARRVSRDCLVSFEGRRYSVPFRWVGHTTEIRGTACHVVILAGGAEVARHARRTASRLVLEPAHFEGESTPDVCAPTPLGHRARRQLAGLPWQGAPGAASRPLGDYVQLVDRLSTPGSRHTGAEVAP